MKRESRDDKHQAKAGRCSRCAEAQRRDAIEMAEKLI